MPTVLITGFEPFGGAEINPSGEIACALDGRLIRGRTIVGAVLPCTYDESLAVLRQLLRRHGPELVICTGLAGGRAEITPERVAINIDDARIADNAGAAPVDRPVVAGGPVAYWSTLPIKAIVATLRERGIPASVSQTAGTFVCNHVFYGLMHALYRQRTKTGRRRVRGGFIHVPRFSGQAPREEPSLPLEMMVAAIALAVDVALVTRQDRRVAGGRTH